MNFGRLAIAALVSWVLYLGVNFVVHTMLLKDMYLEYAGWMRPEAQQQQILPAGFMLALVGFFAFAYTYAKGYEGGSGTQEGLRFGVLVGILICCFATIWEYMVFPFGTMLLLAWCIDHILEFAVYGMVVGAIYRPVASASRRQTAL